MEGVRIIDYVNQSLLSFRVFLRECKFTARLFAWVSPMHGTGETKKCYDS